MRLKRSIISWSFVVFTGSGGSGRANALPSESAVSLVPTDVLCDVGDRVLECLLASCAKSSSSSSSSSVGCLVSTTDGGAEGTTLGPELSPLPSVALGLESGMLVSGDLKFIT